jgi:hypothetical protein
MVFRDHLEIRVRFSQHLAEALLGTAEERLGFGVAPLALIQARQIVHRYECIGMRRPQHPLSHLLRPICYRFRRGVRSLALQEAPIRIQK